MSRSLQAVFYKPALCRRFLDSKVGACSGGEVYYPMYGGRQNLPTALDRYLPETECLARFAPLLSTFHLNSKRWSARKIADRPAGRELEQTHCSLLPAALSHSCLIFWPFRPEEFPLKSDTSGFCVSLWGLSHRDKHELRCFQAEGSP